MCIQRPVHETVWEPSTSNLKVILNATVDAADVPVSATSSSAPRSGRGGGGRLAGGGLQSTRHDRSHVVVLDNLFGETERVPLLAWLNGALIFIYSSSFFLSFSKNLRSRTLYLTEFE